VALGLPLNGEWDLQFLERTRKPRIFVQGEQDEFGDREAIERFANSLTGPVETRIIAGASHLFVGQEDQAVDAVVDALRRALPAG